MPNCLKGDIKTEAGRNYIRDHYPEYAQIKYHLNNGYYILASRQLDEITVFPFFEGVELMKNTATFDEGARLCLSVLEYEHTNECNRYKYLAHRDGNLFDRKIYERFPEAELRAYFKEIEEAA